jgi:hypothetical protein
LIEILTHAGGNCFRIPHVGKTKLERNGRLPDQWCCPAAVKETDVARLAATDSAAYTKALEDELRKAEELTDLCTAFEDVGLVVDPDFATDDIGPDDGSDTGHAEEDPFELWLIKEFV